MRFAVLALIAAALIAVPAGTAAGATPPQIGISDQNVSMFSAPLFQNLGLRYARFVTPWDVALKPTSPEAAKLRDWIVAASFDGVEPLISFEHRTADRCPDRPCMLPSTSAYAKAIRAFRQEYPTVTTLSAWNEASHVTQPTYKHPDAAARYYLAMKRLCPTCTIVAADVLDTRFMQGWLQQFLKVAPSARLWGLHNYGDTNRFRTSGLDTLLATVKGDVWLTETGSIVSFTTSDGRQSFKPSQARAAKAMRYLFTRLVPRSSRIKRVYLYNWRSDPANRWDSGLVGYRGEKRKVYDVVAQYVKRTAAARAGR
ncbi:glycosyl hydrolase [Capillimicrobium parvum]|uniref:Asl1-like glycosyl hydrolase catalytic domain-containing protein n=1 Tax=Capillimicrobium parvum TaxID=2884022 RepID=A0A9E6Y1D7_9ACTN|nr:glycosyl hydrolase [Capillimicrobium parvum]UGS38171.1 hypothetical protein DSM104329_04594 [Capillimicrobium parvum]